MMLRPSLRTVVKIKWNFKCEKNLWYILHQQNFAFCLKIRGRGQQSKLTRGVCSDNTDRTRGWVPISWLPVLTEGWLITHFQRTKHGPCSIASQMSDNTNKKLEVGTIVAIKKLLQQTYSSAYVSKHLAFQSSPKMCEMRAHNSWPLVHDEQMYYMRPMLNKQE